MVLDHSDLLVYASAEDWTKDSEPQDYIKLSAESTIEVSLEGAEVNKLQKGRNPFRVASYDTRQCFILLYSSIFPRQERVERP